MKAIVASLLATIFAFVAVPAYAASYSAYKTCYGWNNSGKEVAAHSKSSGYVRATIPDENKTQTSANVHAVHAESSAKEGQVSGYITADFVYGHADCDY